MEVAETESVRFKSHMSNRSMNARKSVVFGQPFDVEPRHGQMLRGVVSVGAASFVEAVDRAVGSDGEIAVAAPARFE